MEKVTCGIIVLKYISSKSLDGRCRFLLSILIWLQYDLHISCTATCYQLPHPKISGIGVLNKRERTKQALRGHCTLLCRLMTQNHSLDFLVLFYLHNLFVLLYRQSLETSPFILKWVFLPWHARTLKGLNAYILLTLAPQNILSRKSDKRYAQ